MQEQLDLIQKWLSETTEPYTDWDWDGEELTIFCDENVEKYSYQNLVEVIQGF